MIVTERRRRAPLRRRRLEWWHDGHAQLARHPAFMQCSRAEIRRIHQLGDLVDVAPGTQLLAEDRIGYWFFVICEGSLRLTRRGRHVETVHAGGTVGHVAILGMGPQVATVTARTQSRLFILSRRELINVFYTVPSLRRALLPDVPEEQVQARVRQLQAEGRAAWQKVPVKRVLGAPFDRRPAGLVQVHPTRSARQRCPAATAPPPPPRQPLSRRAKLTITTAAVATVLVVAATYRPPVAVIAAGRPFDALEDIRVSGVPVFQPAGRYLVLSVTVERPTVLGLLGAVVRRERVIAASEVPHTDADEQRALFRESQRVAVAVAARQAGMTVGINGTGAVVSEVQSGSAARNLLEPGDVIVSDNGRPVATSLDIDSAREHLLVVERDARRVTVRVRGAMTGVMTRTRQLRVELPFSVRFRARSLGGPSAGLAYALAVADLLDPPDHSRGQAIAATGELAVDGALASVGGLPWKAAGARSRHAAVFLAPASELSLVPKRGLNVRGVRGFDDALAYMLTNGSGPGSSP